MQEYKNEMHVMHLNCFLRTEESQDMDTHDAHSVGSISAQVCTIPVLNGQSPRSHA